MKEKTMGNTCLSTAKANVPDMTTFGGDVFKLISKASSNKEGWMKSTKAMIIGSSVLVQVTTQQRNPDGSYSVAEALALVPNTKIEETLEDGEVISRSLVQWTFPKGS